MKWRIKENRTWSVWSDGPPTIMEPLNDGSTSSERIAAMGDKIAAKKLAHDPDTLRNLRARLRGNCDAFPLFNTERYTRVLEKLIHSVVDSPDGVRIARGVNHKESSQKSAG